MNGNILASTKVADPSTDGYNFLLQIPLSTIATDSTAVVGDTLNCVLVQESGLSLATIPLNADRARALDAFINGVGDIKLGIKAYSRQGN